MSPKCFWRVGCGAVPFLGLWLALPLAGAQKPTEMPQAVAALTQATGEVLVRHGQAWTRVESAPVNLFSGDRVSTDQGRAEIRFLRDDSTLVLDVGTHLTIREAEEANTGRLLRRVEIFLGDVWFQLQHSLSRKTELATPTAVGGLRGTQGVVHVDDATQSQFHLAEGQLEIERRPPPGGPSVGPEKILLTAGHILRVRPGEPLRAHPAAPPTRPAVNVPAKELPKPRKDWRNLIHEGERPPAAGKVAPSVVPRPAQNEPTRLAKPGKSSTVPPLKAPQTPRRQSPVKRPLSSGP